MLMKKIEQSDIIIRKMEQQFSEMRKGNDANSLGRRSSLKKPPNTAPSFQSHARSTILISNQDYISMFENLAGKGTKTIGDPNVKILSHKLIQSYQKNQEDSKLTEYKVSRLIIQVKQKTKEIEKLEKTNKEFQKKKIRYNNHL